MSETHTNRQGFGSLIENRESALVLAFTMVLVGLTAGWADWSLLASETVIEQFWVVPVVFGVIMTLYAQAKGI
jgi:hypothetical protein